MQNKVSRRSILADSDESDDGERAESDALIQTPAAAAADADDDVDDVDASDSMDIPADIGPGEALTVFRLHFHVHEWLVTTWMGDSVDR